MQFDDPQLQELSRVAAFGADALVRRGAKRFALVRVSTRIAALPEHVFDAWLDPAMAGKWLFATASQPMTRVEIDARVRGRFRFADGRDGDSVEANGVYVEISRPWRLAFTLSATRDFPATRVTAEIAPAGRAGAAELTVIHGDVPGEHASRIEARWTGMLYGLGLLLDAQSGRSPPRRRRVGQ